MQAFQSIVSKVQSKLCNWKNRFLSQAGREVLIKAVLQSVPTYCMSVFLLPKTLCQRLNSLISSYWWNGMDDKKKLHWKAWHVLCTNKHQGGCGFRDLTGFNMALLAKQAWRLLTAPTSLPGKIFKAKYFPTSNVLQATLGSRPSYVWRSMWQSLNLLQDGLLWRVGDGKQIHVWHDRWLPRCGSGQIQSPMRVLRPNALVEELIDTHTAWWNVQLVRHIFTETDAATILPIPISLMGNPDKLVWKGTSTGHFSVKSAYHLYMETMRSCIGETSTAALYRPYWKQLWGLSVANSVKTFMWRACSDSLPTKQNLCKRKVVDDDLCPICMLEPESSAHVLWSCPAATDVWMMSGKKLQKMAIVHTDFAKIFKQMVTRLTTKELACFAYIARSLWHRRNAFLYERQFAHPIKLFEKAVTECHLYQQAIQAQVHKLSPVASLVVQWELPPAGFIKFNWDIAVQQPTNRIVIGIVLRDCEGEVLLSLMKPLVFCSNAAYAEARGLFEAVKLCSELGFTNCIFEGDSLHVVQAINTQGSEEFIHNPIIADIKQLLHGTNWSLQHVKRAANQVAHKLAKEALFLNEERLDVDCVNHVISNLVMADCHHSH